MKKLFLSIKEDYSVYRRPLMMQGFWALAFHRYGTYVRSIKIKPIYMVLRVIHLVLIKVSEVFFGIYIGANAVVGKRLIIEHFGSIIINSEAVIGDDVLIRQEVTIGNKSSAQPKDVPIIGSRVDIGAGAKIIGKIYIGNDVLIGANAVVLRDIPDNSIAVGVPAIIKPRKISDR